MSFFSFNRAPSIDEDKIVQEWSQLVLQMGNRGEELLKSIAAKIQELNMPLVTLVRKEATLGKSDNRYEFVSVKHEKYPDYEVWIGAIDRAGQLKVSWFLTVSLPNIITAKMRAINQASHGDRPQRLSKRLGKMLAQKINEKEFAEEVAACEMGKNYLCERKKIEEEYQARRDKLTRADESESFREKKKTEDINYEEIIAGGENDFVEFKSSIRYDYKQGGGKKDIEYIIAKAISAFMNTNGGRLFIGVNDSGEVIGIENDYAAVHHKNKDGFLLQLNNIVNHYLGKEFHQYLGIRVASIKGKDVCVVEVAKSKISVPSRHGAIVAISSVRARKPLSPSSSLRRRMKRREKSLKNG